MLNNYKTEPVKAREMFIYYIKFQLLLIFSRDEYYQYINNVINNDLITFNDPSFNNTIKLDEFPYWEFEWLHHQGTLNFTFVDILDKTYSKSNEKSFNYYDTLSIIDLLKYIFIDGESPLTHDMYSFIDFIKNMNVDSSANGIEKLTIDAYLSEIFNKSKYSLILFFDNIIAIYDILNATKNNTDAIFDSANGGIKYEYENKFVELVDEDRYALFQEYKKYYD